MVLVLSPGSSSCSLPFLLFFATTRHCWGSKRLLLKAHLLLQGHPSPCLLPVASLWKDFEQRGRGEVAKSGREKHEAPGLSSAAPCVLVTYQVVDIPWGV